MTAGFLPFFPLLTLCSGFVCWFLSAASPGLFSATAAFPTNHPLRSITVHNFCPLSLQRLFKSKITRKKNTRTTSQWLFVLSSARLGCLFVCPFVFCVAWGRKKLNRFVLLYIFILPSMILIRQRRGVLAFALRQCEAHLNGTVDVIGEWVSKSSHYRGGGAFDLFRCLFQTVLEIENGEGSFNSTRRTRGEVRRGGKHYVSPPKPF